MFGHIPYNREAFNRTSESESIAWKGAAEAVAIAEGELRLTKRMDGEAAAVAAATATASNVHYVEGAADAKATASSDWIRKVYMGGHAEAVSSASAVGLYQMGADYLGFAVDLNAGDDLVIDTERMTVLRNSQNFIYALDDTSTFFDIGKGDIITVSGSGTATVSVLWKDRWL